MKHALTVYRGARDPVPAQADDLSWPEVVEALSELITKPPVGDKRDLLAIAPHRLREPYRLEENVDAVSMLVIDVDGCDAGALAQRIDSLGIAAVVYGSPSDDETKPDARRVRVVAPTSRELSPDECKDARRAFAELIGLGPGQGVEGAIEASKLFFVGRLEGTPDRAFASADGKPVDVDALLATPLRHDWHVAPPPPADVERPARDDAGTTAGAAALLAALGDCRDWQGSRFAMCGALGGMLRRSGWSRDNCAEVVREWLDVGDPEIKVEPGVTWACKAYDKPVDQVSGRAALDGVVGPAMGALVEAAVMLPERARIGARLPRVGADDAHAGTGATPSTWRVVRMADPEEPIEWRCEGLRLATSNGKVSLIAGQPNAGKGPLADYLAICLALGVPAFGYPCEAAPTLLLDWEGTRLTMRRLRRMARGLGRDPLSLDACLTVVDASGVRDPLSPVWLQQLADEVARLGARHIVIDSYTSAMLSLEIESNSTAYARLAQALGELDALVLIVAHANKQSAASAKPGLHHVSGTGALVSLAQTAILVHRPDDEDEHRVRLTCGRAPETGFAAFDVRFADRADGALTLTAEAVGAPAAKTETTPAPRGNEHAPDVRVAGARILRVLVEEPLAHAFAELERRGGEGPRAAKQALARLCDAGLADCVAGQYSATDAGAAASDGAVAAALGHVAGFGR